MIATKTMQVRLSKKNYIAIKRDAKKNQLSLKEVLNSIVADAYSKK